MQTPVAWRGSDLTMRTFLILATLTVMWTAVLSAISSSVPLDVIETLNWAGNLDWGYHKHPPLSAFLVAGTQELAGLVGAAKHDWPYFFLAQLALLTCYAAIFACARVCNLTQVQALAATIPLIAIPFYNYSSVEFNPNMALAPFWAAFGLFLLLAVKSGRLIYWAGCGLVGALAILTKYTGGMLVLAALGAILTHSRLRPLLASKGPYVMGLVAAVALIPHALWTWEHDFATVTYALQRSNLQSADLIDHFVRPIYFLTNYIGPSLPALLVLVWAGWRGGEEWQTSDRLKDRDPLIWLVLWLAFFPVLLTALLAAVTGAKVKTMWGYTFPLFLPLALVCVTFRSFEVRRIWLGALGFAMIGLCAVVLSIWFSPLIGTKVHRIDNPGREIAAAAVSHWQSETAAPLELIAGGAWWAGLVAHYGDADARVIINGDLGLSNSVTQDEVRNRGVLYVWNRGRRESYPSEAWRACLTAVSEQDFTPEWLKLDVSARRHLLLAFGIAKPGNTCALIPKAND